jgi:hypothetical protein
MNSEDGNTNTLGAAFPTAKIIYVNSLFPNLELILLYFGRYLNVSTEDLFTLVRLFQYASTGTVVYSVIRSFINGSTALCWTLASYSFRYLFYTVGMIPWTGHQPVARLLPPHRTAQTQDKCTHGHPCLEWDKNPQS